MALIEVRKAIGEMVALQMKDKVDTINECEHNKLEVPVKLFFENMLQQCEKKCWLYEQNPITTNKACQAIFKHGEFNPYPCNYKLIYMQKFECCKSCPTIH